MWAWQGQSVWSQTADKLKACPARVWEFRLGLTVAAAALALADRRDLDELRAQAAAGVWFAAQELAGLLADHGDLDGLRVRADAGDVFAADRLAGLLADRGDLDGAVQILRTMADAGDGNAAELAEFLTKQGRIEEAERLRRFGLNPDGSVAWR